MLLNEFVDDDPLRVSLVAITSQIKSRIADTKAKSSMSTDAFLALLKRNGVILDHSDIYDLVQQPPLSNIIDNISGQKVIFKGQSEDTGETQKTADSHESTVEKMAQRAAK